MNVPAHDDIDASFGPRLHRSTMPMQQILFIGFGNHMHRLMHHHDTQLCGRRLPQTPLHLLDLLRRHFTIGMAIGARGIEPDRKQIVGRKFRV